MEGSFSLSYRKDSFITHRAFCDALAGEILRFRSVTASSLNFSTDMKSGLTHGFVDRVQDNIVGLAQVQQKSRLSLWLNQASPEPLNNAGSNLFGLMGSTNMLENTLLSLSPVTGFGSYGQLFPSASSANINLLKEPKENHNLSRQQNVTMSATALLQKAAQMGSTRSNPSSIFGNTFGVMISSSNNSRMRVLNPMVNIDEGHQGSRVCGPSYPTT